MIAIHRNHTARGFTLLEMIVVVTIIALLASFIAPRLLGNVDKAKVAKARGEVNMIAQQVSIFCLDHNQTAPPEDFELAMLTAGDRAPFKPGDLIDPWTGDYLLLIPGQTDPDFNVASYGADGQPGGDGYAADILNQ